MQAKQKRRIAVICWNGREHAMLWRLAQNPRVDKLFAIPGNGGSALLATNIDIDPNDNAAVVAAAKENTIDLVIIGPDSILGNGLADDLQKAGIDVFGPTKAAAQIETSKAFAKDIMQKAGVHTAAYREFPNYKDALQYCEQAKFPLVIKADGLTGGKGVSVCKTLSEAKAALKTAMQDEAYGVAGAKVIIEDFVEGVEISLHVVSDGKTYAMFPAAQDHKPIGEGDSGPNTGGMGTVAPLPWLSQARVEELGREVIAPTLAELEKSGHPFVGCLYPSVMISKTKNVVIEYNARFGDPEMESYLRVMKSDFLEMVEACIAGTLTDFKLEWEDAYACCIVLASGDYPGKIEIGKEITGIEEAEKLPDIVVFQAGTKRVGNKLVTNGGRVLEVTATGKTLDEALQKAYQAIEQIHFEGMQYRTDIGRRAIPEWAVKP